MPPIRIIIVDDNDLIRDQIRPWLEARPGFEVVATARDGMEAVSLVAQWQPDVVLMDISMPIMNGLEATALVTRQFPRSRVIVHSSSTAVRDVWQAFQAGAFAYLVKGSNARLDLVIVDVAAGKSYVDPSVPMEALNFSRDPCLGTSSLEGSHEH